MPLISVIIPLYNKDFIIKKTLDSVLNQRFTNFEVIIVNDGSTDDSEKIVNAFSDTRIILVNQSNKGVSSARNVGIQHANSELIALLDADDYWYANHLQKLYDLYTVFPNCGMYCSRYKTQISADKFITNSFIGIDENYAGIINNYFEASLIKRIASSSSVLIPKKILVLEKGFNTNATYFEDHELWTKIAIKYDIAITNNYTAIYNFNINKSLSKINLNLHNLPDFKQFEKHENENPSLKKFLDIYRLEFSLKYRLNNNIEKSNFYLKDISSKIPIKTRILLKTPVFILNFLIKLKHLMKKSGLDFTIYH